MELFEVAARVTVAADTKANAESAVFDALFRWAEQSTGVTAAHVGAHQAAWAMLSGDGVEGGVVRGGLEPGRVYEIAYSCDTPGPDVREGLFRGVWTGEVDTGGKLTFYDVGAGEPLYLFEREIVRTGEAF